MKPISDRARSGLLSAVGALLVLCGAGLLLLAPLESVCLTFFSPGGRFAYEGFGYGSLMFFLIAMQMLAYDLLAALLLTLGWGHLKGRRWTPALTQATLWAWLVTGLPVIVVAFFLLAGTKDMAPALAYGSLAALALGYFALPWLLLRWYAGPGVTGHFARRDPGAGPPVALPMPILAAALLYGGFVGLWSRDSGVLVPRVTIYR
jgi:hypothetical protein